MKSIKNFSVKPKLPPPLARLRDLAYNLWWTWNPEAIDLFRRLDPTEWENTYHNPVKMLGSIAQETLEERAQDESFLAHLHRVSEDFQAYMSSNQTWYGKKYGPVETPQIAYFSAEFGIAECLPLYSGGLGMLAGDHLKSASDLGLPLAGVGLLYRVGYFQQYLNAGGWQQELYPENDFHNMPITPLKDEKGDQMSVRVQLPGRDVHILLWKAQIGRVPLILLDCDTSRNQPQDRRITGELYGGTIETRIQQEIVLGIGGLKALHALNYHPPVYHMNEGHSAFLALERIRVAMERHQMTFSEAHELTRSSNLFTTHTPVPAGIDVFSGELMDRYFSSFAPTLGISWQDFLNIGWQTNTPKGDGFSMAVCAINLAAHCNGVSVLHAKVSREMWKDLFPGFMVNEVPICSVTNGVHQRSYISKEMSQLYDRYLGPKWLQPPAEKNVWKLVESIPSEELWRTHERRRERLVAFARKRLAEQFKNQGAPPSEIQAAGEVLDPEALTIGFARRFATYKRATLIFKDVERLARILGDRDRPVQIIIAGKAHPQDQPGKQFIKDIVAMQKDPRLARHIVFIENYDVNVARYLVQGVDVWLNNPRRPLEASGTSGMKASANGGLNLSVLDGWWDEGYSPEVGWAIGRGEEYKDKDSDYQDQVEANALYELMEKEVVPLFYTRSNDGLPRGWIHSMKQNLARLCPVFNTDRMVAEYFDKFYRTGNERYRALSANDRQRARELAKWLATVRTAWPNIRIEDVESDLGKEHQVGEEIPIRAKLFLERLKPADVLVQAYVGRVGSDDQISDGHFIDLAFTSKEGDRSVFSGHLGLNTSGRIGFSVRVLPKNADLVSPVITRLVHWSHI